MNFNLKTAHLSRVQDFIRILSPEELSHEPGKEVLDPQHIFADATLMMKAIDSRSLSSIPSHRSAYALAHHQVSKDHYSFFTTNKYFKDAFGGRVVMNPKYVSAVGADVMPLKEGCISHPHESYKIVKRFNVIEASWFDEAMRMHQEKLGGILAQVFQHEADHCMGITITDVVK